MSRLRNFSKSVLNTISGGISLSALIKLTGQKLFLPFYHVVSDEPVNHVRHLYPVRGIKQFEKDLDYLLKYFEPIGPEELAGIANGQKKIMRPSFFLTFDDGLRQMQDVVAPVLLRKGIPAAFFINSGFVDNKALFYRYKLSLLVERLESGSLTTADLKEAGEGLPGRGINLRKELMQLDYSCGAFIDKIAKIWEVDFENYLKTYQPYLTTAQCVELRNNGFSIGAHSVDHPMYSTITMEEQLRQTKESMNWVLTHKLDNSKLFAFPFTDHNVSRAFFDQVLAEKAPVLDLSFGGAGLKQDYDSRHFQRFPMEGTLESAQKLIGTEYLYYILKMPFKKNRITRV